MTKQDQPLLKHKPWVRGLVLAAAGTAVLWGVADRWTGPASALAGDYDDERVDAQQSATNSSPIAITSDNKFVWSVNPDNDSVSVFRVANDTNKKVAEIRVGKEPWCVAITLPEERHDSGKSHRDDDEDGKVFVTNMVSGTVSVIDRKKRKVVDTIKVGTEPFGCALTPDGRKLYIANQSSETVSVIDTKWNRVIKTIKEVGTKPHGIAITADGRKVYVTQLLSERPAAGDPRPLTQSEGSDNGRVGRVTVIDAHTDHVIKTVILNPLPNVGDAFKSDGNTLAREPLTNPPPPVFDNVTGAFPNLLEAIAVRGNIAYVPGTCSSPNGPFRFNVNVQSCLSTIDTALDVEAFGAGTTLNMNVGVNFEPVGIKLFNTNPFAVAFKRKTAEGFVALAATDRLLRITLDADGRPTINPPASAADPSKIVRIQLKAPNDIVQADPEDVIGGKNPRGIVLNSKDTRAYVMDFVSRDIAVVDISGDDPTLYRTIARIQSADLPAAAPTRRSSSAGSSSSIAPSGQWACSTTQSARPGGCRTLAGGPAMAVM
jgi:YVTN family beta-propeller protein